MSQSATGSHGDGFLPTLLDRLVDSSPSDGKGLTRRAYRDTVLRDLRWLLNTVAPLSENDLMLFPALRDSVLNYGIRGATGISMTESELHTLARRIEQAILAFEPRIVPGSLSVRVVSDAHLAVRNSFVFRIKAQFWFEPFPLELAMRAQWDVENGLVGLAGE